MDSPVRKMLKRNDYNRHKLLRKIKRLRRAQVEQQKTAAEKELKRRLRVTPPKFGDGKDPYSTVIADLKNTRINPDTGGVQLVDNEGNIIAQEGGYELPEIVVNGVDIDRIKKHANTSYNDNTRVGLERGTYANMTQPDEAALIATSIPGALISAPILGPGLLKAGDAFLGTTLGRNATLFFANPYTQTAMFSAGLADTVDRRLIRGQHPNYSENPLMAGIEDVFDASMLASGAAGGYNVLNNAIRLRKPVLNPQQHALNEQLLLENVLQDQKLLPKLKYTMGDIVDSDGNVNTKNAMTILRDIVNKYNVDLKNPHYHLRNKIDLPTIRHMWESAKTAKTLPVPKGGTKQEQVFAALVHDLGRLRYDVNHEAESVNLLNRYFNNLSPEVLLAVQKHMGYTIPFESDFVKALHAADIGSGLSGELTLRKFPYSGYTSSENLTNLGKKENLGLREIIRTRLNPYFDTMDGMEKIPLDATEELARDIVRRNMKLYRHVGRGLQMPVYGETHLNHTSLNQRNAIALTRQVVGNENFTSDDVFKTMLTHAALGNTGHGKQDYKTFVKTLQGLDEYHGAQPIYTSNTRDVMLGYSGNSSAAEDASAAVGAYVPEVYNDNMSLEDIILANEWPLYDPKGKLHPQYDYETPYRVRTGRSLRLDALRYFEEHLEEYPGLLLEIEDAKNSLYPSEEYIKRGNKVLEESTNGRIKNYFDKYTSKSESGYSMPRKVGLAMDEVVREDNAVNYLEWEIEQHYGSILNPKQILLLAKDNLPKEEYKIFQKHSYMIYPKKAREVSATIGLDYNAFSGYSDKLKQELLTRINSTRRNAADRFFKRKELLDKKAQKDYAYKKNSLFSRKRLTDEQIDIYEKLLKQNGVLPMHSTNEMRSHPYAFTTEGLRKNVSRQQKNLANKGKAKIRDDHQHYVFYGKSGEQLLENAEILNIQGKNYRSTGHGGRRHPDFTPKMNSLYPFALPFVGYGLNSKDNHKKK